MSNDSNLMLTCWIYFFELANIKSIHLPDLSRAIQCSKFFDLTFLASSSMVVCADWLVHIRSTCHSLTSVIAAVQIAQSGMLDNLIGTGWGIELTHRVKISPCSSVSLPLVSKTLTPQHWKNQAPKTHHGWETQMESSVEEFTCPFRQVQISNQSKHFNNIQYICSTMYHLRFILLVSLIKSSCNLFILL